MINLIPPSAKKSVITEYRLRVLSVWFYLWAAMLVVGIFILIPTYVLITLQVSAYTDSSENATKRIADYESVTKNLDNSNQQAAMLMNGFADVSMSKYVKVFRQMENSDIELSKITIERVPEKSNTVQLTGEAGSRQALAAFRDRLESEPLVESVNFPISNLAKDKEILFNITVTLKKEAS